ncbi:apn-1 [Bugula neritina]|uniref:Apn-1 n=1 Tax=Bugula neritina TaxID=10212 RepID=A0A7J7KQ40_BUGNE|nr:apn-1 [Bugula neritina]
MKLILRQSLSLQHQSYYIIENMSCQGNTIGGKFEELAAIIDLVKDKSRIGVCLDTCHAFAAGFDLRTEEGYYDVMTKFDKIIGFKYLKALHINDSKGDLGCHLDRHEQIGKGKIGMKAFSLIMNDSRLGNIPLILETPDEHRWEQEIKTLYSLIKT